MILSLGAINKITGEYIYPKIANKKDEYICPECNKELILCQGDIKKHHFRHKIDNVYPCHHYSNPSESEIHKDAKQLLKTILERKIPISFIRNCCGCHENEEFKIPEISEISVIELEYRFEFNGIKIADVAYIDDGELLCIFEICNTHKTCSENRPEPWFEIDAEALIKLVNSNSINSSKVHCIRCEKCDDCIELQQARENYKKKQKQQAIDILYNWFSPYHYMTTQEEEDKAVRDNLPFTNEIPPFNYHLGDFDRLEKNSISNFTDEIFDLIIYIKDNDGEIETVTQRYCIRLIYNSSECYFTKEHIYAEHQIGIYYLNINWILSQKTIPTIINYIASLDYYQMTIDRDGIELFKYKNYKQFNEHKCNNCGKYSPFWVKRMNNKVIYIGNNCYCLKKNDDDICCNKKNECDYINCERCNSTKTPLWVMETNTINNKLCKQCDIELYTHGRYYLYVPFDYKEEVKSMGAKWDCKYKKWFIHKWDKGFELIIREIKWEDVEWGIMW
ncbi:competence protein CoiA family protein [bacterium]|nr:competence protein CoiA family protein [bacterium]